MSYFDLTEATYKGYSEDFNTEVPLSITLQVTRKCNLKCIYCSEVDHIPAPSLDELLGYAEKLRGIERVIISGGEPTTRGDLLELLRRMRGLGFPVLSMATNATLMTPKLAAGLSKYLDYADITIDGTREIHNTIRGEFSRVLAGARMLREAGVPLCIVTVMIKRNSQTLPEILELSNDLNAIRIKIISPIPKGRGQEVMNESLTHREITELHGQLCSLKKKKNYGFTITFTEWSKVKEGHALLVHPDGAVVASPVPSKPGCVDRICRISETDAKGIWELYPYKKNHVAKYFDRSLLTC